MRGDLLKLAKERGVKGIAEWFYYKITIDSNPDTIAYLRRGIKFGHDHYNLRRQLGPLKSISVFGPAESLLSPELSPES